MHKSRYGSCYSYISDSDCVQDYHNDYIRYKVNEGHLNKMKEAGVSRRLSEHFSNLLVRDPLLVYENVEEFSQNEPMFNFEVFNSTNWNTVRFKPPRSIDGDNFFKIEVRPCEIQLTSFENSALLAFILLYNKIVLNYNTNFVIPISKVDENIDRSVLNDAVYNNKFYWRTNGIEINKNNKNKFLIKNSDNQFETCKDKDSLNVNELTMSEILLGKEEFNYPGLFKVMIDYIDNNLSNNLKETYKSYLNFLEKRAKGELWTDAKYIRHFVLSHKEYKKDSQLNNVNILIKKFYFRK